jgi:ribosomal protein S20
MKPEEIKRINDLFTQIDQLTEENKSLKSGTHTAFNDTVIAFNARLDEISASFAAVNEKLDKISDKQESCCD